MLPATFFDFSPYCRPPRISASSGVMLSIRLLRVAPESPPKQVHAALVDVRDRAETVQAVLRERHRLRSIDLRPLDHEFDGAWAALHGRLYAHTRIAGGEDSRKAAELLAALFPDGLVFLTAAYEEEWLHSNTLLQRIQVEGHEVLIKQLAGDAFLQHVVDAHQALGDGLGLGSADPEELPAVGPAVTLLAQAIANYGRLLAGTVDLALPESIQSFQAAMAPRDALLARRRGESAQAGDELEGDELDEVDVPLPPVPEPAQA
jgi:hypothetical protein